MDTLAKTLCWAVAFSTATLGSALGQSRTVGQQHTSKRTESVSFYAADGEMAQVTFRNRQLAGALDADGNSHTPSELEQLLDEHDIVLTQSFASGHDQVLQFEQAGDWYATATIQTVGTGSVVTIDLEDHTITGFMPHYLTNSERDAQGFWCVVAVFVVVYAIAVTATTIAMCEHAKKAVAKCNAANAICGANACCSVAGFAFCEEGGDKVNGPLGDPTEEQIACCEEHYTEEHDPDHNLEGEGEIKPGQ